MADTVFVLTEQALESVSRAVPSNTKVVRTRNGVAIPPSTSVKEKIFLFGGEVSERKGADVLIESWTSLKEQTRGWKLLVAGPVRISTDGCGPNVEFLGQLPHDSILDLQRRASVAVLPSRAEALPMFLLESMANGCAVIATPVGQVEKLITGCGLVVETGSASSLAAALNLCITDPDLAQRFGERGRQRVTENFSDQVVRDELERHWLEMKNRRGEKKGTKAILVASTGGHLAQLNRLQGRLGIESDPLWITFDHPQSRSMLNNSRVTYVPYIAPRDIGGLLRAFPKMIGSIRKEPANVVVSTGAAIALLALPIAVLFKRRAVYVESVSRFDGPSVSGRILAKVPGVETYTQHKSWASAKWAYRTSVLQDYSVTPQNGVNLDRPKVFVTLGTIKPYRFDRLVDALIAVLPSDAEVIWQMGVTQRTGLPGKVHSTLTSEQFCSAVRDSDIVISHAGVGSAMQILDLGKCPVLVPRRAAAGEHVDDHQTQIARELAKLDLAICLEADEIEWDELVNVTKRAITAADACGKEFDEVSLL
ncbi:glycosyltransferase [Rhodococcus fascians]|nr:glycosyltransferase [Rhodococcus fascians]